MREWALVWSTSEGFVKYAEEGLGLSRQFITHVRGNAMNKVIDDINKEGEKEKLRPPSTVIKARGIVILNDLLCKSDILNGLTIPTCIVTLPMLTSCYSGLHGSKLYW